MCIVHLPLVLLRKPIISIPIVSCSHPSAHLLSWLGWLRRWTGMIFLKYSPSENEDLVKTYSIYDILENYLTLDNVAPLLGLYSSEAVDS